MVSLGKKLSLADLDSVLFALEVFSTVDSKYSVIHVIM